MVDIVWFFYFMVENNCLYGKEDEQMKLTKEEKQLEIKKLVGNYCRYFRKHKLCLTLEEFSDLYGINYKSLSGFENGRSSNYFYIVLFIKACKKPDLQLGFVQGMNKAIDSYNFFVESEEI